MSDAQNPLVPAGYDIMWSTITALALALTVVALISLTRSARGLGPTRAIIWTLLILCLPILGAAAWLTVGRRAGESTSS